ncbi:MAG: cytochrome ubiquinol oxidase subunit I [Candidatus Rhabdochlamydia sp.]
MTVEILSRIQFAFTLTFHYIYPPLSIGLSLALIFMEGMYLKTKLKIWEDMTKFWLKIFALTFALGVATGIPLQFSLGTNWARYSRFVGDVFGSALSAEGFFAFLIEGGFLGLLLFGWKKVSSTMHFLSTILVSFGAHFSAFWIVAANSWMQYPTGYELVTQPDGTVVAQVTNWVQMLFNPTAIDHIVHVILSAWLTGAFLIISVSAYYLLKKRHFEFAVRSFKLGILMTFISGVLQLVSADLLARDVAKYNPVKLAAFEGVFETKPYTPAFAFGWVDVEKQKVHGLPIPGLLSFLVYRDFKSAVPGLNEFPREEWPLIQPVFQVYHLMIICWGLMMLASLIGLYMWWKKKWILSPILQWFLILSVILPQLANIAGWYSSCMGRQPWIVHKLLKTSEGFSETVTVAQNLTSLILFVIIYLLFLVLFLFLLDKKIKHGQNLVEDADIYRDLYPKDKSS